MNGLIQSSFASGMDLLNKDIDIASDGYKMLVNARNRFGSLQAIQKPVDITYNLIGNPQGIYGVGNVMLAFYSGNAYYMIIGQTHWTHIPEFQLSPSVEYIYAEAVTGSVNNFLRKAVVTNNVVDASAGVINEAGNTFVSGTPSGIICQDGINQPWLITYDVTIQIASARLLNTYDQWTNDPNAANSREYVPIMSKMVFHPSNILFGVAPDGFTIYRSVSGRPLDFMVNIDQDGNKLVTEALGGAQTTSLAIDFNAINALSVDPSTEALLIGTAHNVYGMGLDFTKTIFDEPTFTKLFSVSSGIVNQFCFTERSGDNLFLDYDGVKSYNGVTQLKFKGLNDPFSKWISSLFIKKLPTGREIPINQTVCCAGGYDNYNLFAINTKYGFLLAIYDNIVEEWTALDINEATIGGIKKFATLINITQTYEACQNSTGKIYLLFSHSTGERCTASLYTRAFTTGSLFDETKGNSVKVAVAPGLITGTLRVRELIDDQRFTENDNTTQEQSKSITGVTCGINYPVIPPVITDNKGRINNVSFMTNQGITGFKQALIISWDCDLQLYAFQTSVSDINKQQSQKQNP